MNILHFCCCKGKFPKHLLKVYITVFACFFSSGFSLALTLPFLPFMVGFLLPQLTEEEIGTYAGIVGSAPFFGRIPSSFLWGVLADYKGRKPVIVSSMLLVGLVSGAFGFSVNFAMAFIFRFLLGLFNGVVGTCKAIISDVSDDSNQSIGVALLGTSFGLGIILGPAVSGAISDPIGQYNITVDNTFVREFLVKFPYSPPCLLSALLCTLSALLALCFLPETLATKKTIRDFQTLMPADIVENEMSEGNELVSRVNETSENEKLLLANLEVSETNENSESKPDDCTEGQSTALLTNNENNIDVATVDDVYSCNSDEDKVNLIKDDTSVQRQSRLKHLLLKSLHLFKSSVTNIVTLFWDKSVALSLICYTTFSSIDYGFNEIYSVWAKTSPHLGGLGFSLSDIGITLSVSTALLIPISLLLFPLLERKIGLLRLFYTQSMVLIPAVILLPNVHFFYNTKWLLWVLVCSVLLVLQVCLSLGLSCLISFVNNSVTSDKLGKVNGIGMTLAAISRSVSALLSGKLFSVSLVATGAGLSYPLDYRLVFLLFGLVFMLCVFMAACLPVSINKQKKITTS